MEKVRCDVCGEMAETKDCYMAMFDDMPIFTACNGCYFNIMGKYVILCNGCGGITIGGECVVISPGRVAFRVVGRCRKCVF